jgi:acyl-CoA reductase-like NAD-dependent aldehyde dehydrogenase
MTVDPFPNYIAGTWTAGRDAAPNINPSDLSDTIGDYARASACQTAEAIEAAATAFPKWRTTSPLVRFEALDRIGSEILARVDELGDMLAREEGKTLPEATAEAHRAGHLFKYFAAEAYRTTGDIYQSLRSGVSLKVLREPIGVVGVITPWNFPLAIPAWKIAPALAYGNTVVFKPAELVPGSAWMMSDIIARAGLPEGVFNLVMGTGRDVGEAIVAHPKVSGVTFTGSTPVGRNIGAALFARGAKMQLEMGGKNPLIVLDDADLDLAVHCAIQGSFFSTGQRCTASSRLIVTEGIHDQFVTAMTVAMKDLRVGDARAAETQIGPVASAPQLAIDKRYVSQAQRLPPVAAQSNPKTPDIILLRPCLRMCRRRQPWRGTKSLAQSPLYCASPIMMLPLPPPTTANSGCQLASSRGIRPRSITSRKTLRQV